MNTVIESNIWNLLDSVFGAPVTPMARAMRARAAGRFPPVNVYLDDDAVIIDLELPGKTAKDVDLSLEAQAVMIADKPAPVADDGADTTDPPAPAWSRRLELPFRVNADKANARFTNGILRIELPRAESAGARRIAIAG